MAACRFLSTTSPCFVVFHRLNKSDSEGHPDPAFGTAFEKPKRLRQRFGKSHQNQGVSQKSRGSWGPLKETHWLVSVTYSLPFWRIVRGSGVWRLMYFAMSAFLRARSEHWECRYRLPWLRSFQFSGFHDPRHLNVKMVTTYCYTSQLQHLLSQVKSYQPIFHLTLPRFFLFLVERWVMDIPSPINLLHKGWCHPNPPAVSMKGKHSGIKKVHKWCCQWLGVPYCRMVWAICKINACWHIHRIHAWYICSLFVDFNGNVGKYTIHRAYGF